MPLSALALVAVLLALAVTAGGARGTEPDEIVFASDRRAALMRPAIHGIRPEGRDRMRISPPLPGADALVPAPRGGGFAFLHRSDLYVVRGATVRRLTRGGRIDEPPAWSPDGSRLAYYRSRGEGGKQTDLLVVRADGRARRVLSRSRGVGLFGAPAWSPDGTQLVAAREVGLETRLTVLDAPSGKERVLTAGSSDSDPAWAPDGRRVAFTRTWGFQDDRSVFTVAVGSRRLREVARVGDQPAWSPDGRRLAYHVNDLLYVVSPERGRARRVARSDLLRDDGDDWPHFPIAWSPDSHELAVVVRGEIWAVRVDGGGRRQITHERPGREIVTYPAWAERIAFASKPRDAGDRDLYAIRTDGKGIRELTRNDLDEDEPAWSPDGRRIAFTRFRGSRAEIVVLDGTRAGGRVVATGADPAWSPDGRTLAYVRGDKLYLLDVASGEERQAAAAVELSGPTWSLDGQRLAFSEEVVFEPGVNGSRIVVVGRDGSGRVAITEAAPDHASEDPTWAPDGSVIAFAFGETNVGPLEPRDILGVAPTGGPARPLVSIGFDMYAAVSEPTWAPDGVRLAFVRTLESDDGGLPLVTQLAIRNLAAGGTRVVYAGPGSVSSPAWRPR